MVGVGGSFVQGLQILIFGLSEIYSFFTVYVGPPWKNFLEKTFFYPLYKPGPEDTVRGLYSTVYVWNREKGVWAPRITFLGV